MSDINFVNKNGDLIVEDEEEWAKSVCCIVDYENSCSDPDDTVPIQWEVPPACSEDYDGEVNTEYVEEEWKGSVVNW